MESLLRDSVTERTNPMASQGGQEARYHAGGRSNWKKLLNEREEERKSGGLEWKLR